MNQKQAKRVVKLYNQIEHITGRTGEELHLGDGSQIVNIEVKEDDPSDLEGLTGDLGWVTVCFWMGGTGAIGLLDRDGKLYQDPGDESYPHRAVLDLVDDPYGLPGRKKFTLIDRDNV